MLILAAVLTVASVVALVVAIAFSSSLLIAGICVALSALGLLLLIGDAVRNRPQAATESTATPLPVEHPHTAGDELFGEHEVEREIDREEHVISHDMLGDNVPNEELMENLRHGGHGPGGHHEHRPEA